MATTYKQARETHKVEVYTDDFRLSGTVHLVPGKSVQDLVNGDRRDVLPLTDVKIYSNALDRRPPRSELLGKTPFLGVNRAQILWVIGGESADKFGVALKDVKTVLLFPGFMIAGDMRIPTASRVTDHLTSAQRFQVFKKVQVFPRTEGRLLSQLVAAVRYEVATVNTQKAVGVLEG